MIRLLSVLLLVAASTAQAQLYPTTQRERVSWMELKTPHFRILYPEGYEATARTSGRILEAHHDTLTALFGTPMTAFPVVVDPFSDAGNGYVTSFPFRIEFQTAPIKGDILNPRSGTWLESMLPHELVHAAQLNTITGNSMQGLAGIFSKDLAHAFHLTTPVGLTEGIAVHYESSITESGGRLNHAYFTSQYNHWGLWSSITPAGATYPVDRHYIGGALFTDFLLERYGERRLAAFFKANAANPLLGSGWHMRRQFGKWSWELDREYREWAGPGVERRSPDGMRFTHPQWLDDVILIAHGSSYRGAPGFHVMRADNLVPELVKETHLTEDGYFTLEPSRRNAVYSRYAPHPRHEGRAALVTEELVLQNRRVYRVADGVHGVSITPDSVHALKPLDQMKQRVVPNPVFGNLTAVIGRKQGIQGIWFVYPKHEDLILGLSADIRFPNGSILDAKWSADGLRLVITADHGGSLQLYVYDYESDEMVKVTDEPGGAYHGSFSPDGRRLAYVTVDGDRRPVRIMELDSATKTGVPREVWATAFSDPKPGAAMGSDVSMATWTTAPYRAGRHDLTPGLWFPILSKIQTGLFVAGGEPLRRDAYNAYIGYGQNKPYASLSYTTTRVYPSLTLRGHRLPISSGVGNKIRYEGDEAALRLEAGFRHMFDTRGRYTAVEARPFIGTKRVDQVNGYESTTLNTGGSVFLAYKLRQFLRDPMPSAGYAAILSTDVDLAFDEGPFASRDPMRAFAASGYAFTPWGIRLDGELFLQNRSYYNLTDYYSTTFNTRGLFDVNTTSAYAIGFRYALPFAHPDTKWPLMPFYSERLYAVAFAKHLVESADQARAIVGGGLRFKGRFAGIGFDIGAGVAYDPSRGDVLFTTAF